MCFAFKISSSPCSPGYTCKCHREVTLNDFCQPYMYRLVTRHHILILQKQQTCGHILGDSCDPAVNLYICSNSRTSSLRFCCQSDTSELSEHKKQHLMIFMRALLTTTIGQCQVRAWNTELATVGLNEPVMRLMTSSNVPNRSQLLVN